MLQLAVFLGNPGLKYERTRHNAGWMLADAMPFSHLLSWQKKDRGLYACKDGLHFLKPQTFMNLSGESALAVASFFKIKPDQIIVVHDEIELYPGTLSLKFSGGLGGHNGLRSMKASFGTADFWRLRIGVGRPDGREPGTGGSIESSKEAGIAAWVLSDFSSDEKRELGPVLSSGAELLAKAFAEEPQSLLPEWTKKNCLASSAAATEQ